MVPASSMPIAIEGPLRFWVSAIQVTSWQFLFWLSGGDQVPWHLHSAGFPAHPPCPAAANIFFHFTGCFKSLRIMTCDFGDVQHVSPGIFEGVQRHLLPSFCLVLDHILQVVLFEVSRVVFLWYLYILVCPCCLQLHVTAVYRGSCSASCPSRLSLDPWVG